MPWSETSPMDQRIQFVSDYLRDSFSMTELCARYGVSRKTGYKWIDRYIKHGPEALEERPRRPLVSPNKTPDRIEDLIVQTRLRHPTWGGKKILDYLRPRYPNLTWPHRSTACEILKRRGLAKPTPKRRKVGHPGKPSAVGLEPNDVWCSDFKGEFRTRDRRYCYPLTITDDYSRKLLCCHGLLSTRVDDAIPVFTRIFKEFGLPRRILTDNGVPFATNTLGRLSRLSAWWVKLGIVPVLIQPGCPQQNGRHERMHRTLKAEATKPPAANRRAQQRKFNHFIDEFNSIRPHDALDGQVPDDWYEPSSREFPRILEPFEYPDRIVSRYVSANGGIRWNCRWVNVSTTLAGDYVGFEEIHDGVWDVWFGPMKIGRFHERLGRIEDAFARLKRHNK